jgi:dTDP-4-dehydrorhamnose reductase
MEELILVTGSDGMVGRNLQDLVSATNAGKVLFPREANKWLD